MAKKPHAPRTATPDTGTTSERTVTQDASSSPGDASRPTARARPAPRAPIGDIMAGVSLAAPRSGAGAPGPQPRHPIGSGIAFERVENVYRMDPRKIVLEGPYVRQFAEDAAFHQLRAAVALERDIGQHVGVRIVGPPTDQRRVLVYGMRRWKAALAEGLEKVPVRDYGPISEEKAVELQMLENEIRADPHPVDTALGFYFLSSQEAWNQKRIGQVFDKNKGYVSEMVRVGEAIARLTDAERAALYTAPAVTVRAFQSIAQLKDVEARRQALLALRHAATADADRAAEPQATPGAPTGAPPAPTDRPHPRAQIERRRAVDDAVFHARALRNGRSFRVRWTDEDLATNATAIAAEFKQRFLEEYTHLLHRAAVLAGHGAGPGLDIASIVAEAAKDAARVDARLAAVTSAAPHTGEHHGDAQHSSGQHSSGQHSSGQQGDPGGATAHGRGAEDGD
jgi:ParB-like chromosome segregation protein Spo0J